MVSFHKNQDHNSAGSNPSLAEEMKKNSMRCILNTCLGTTLRPLGEDQPTIEGKFAAAFHILKKAMESEPLVFDVGPGVVKEGADSVRGFVLFVKELTPQLEDQLVAQASELVKPFPVKIIPNDFIEKERNNWHLEREDRVNEMKAKLSCFSNVRSVTQVIRQPSGEATNGVLVEIDDPDHPSMTEIKAMISSVLKKPMWVEFGLSEE